MKRMKSLTSLFLMALFSVVMFVSPAYADTPQEQSDSEWTLVFSDEFNGTEINEAYWNKYPAAIDEEDYFYYGSTPETVVCPENVFVENGSLHILAEYNPIDLGDGLEHLYRTGMLQSRDKIELTYGRFEARIKMPDLPGSNPAFWLMPHKYADGFSFIGLEDSSGNEGYGAEVDILEHIYTDGNKYQTTVHWGGYEESHQSWTATPKPEMQGDPFDWHVFAVEWTPYALDFMVDGEVVATYSGVAVPQGPEFIIFSLGMGGNWIGEPDVTKMPAEMLVDYVRVYQKDSYDPDTIADGTYTIKSAFSGKYLDVSTDEGSSNVVQKTGNGSDSQKWIVSTNADGSRTIKNVADGTVLDVYGQQTQPGANIIHWIATGKDNQKWNILPSGNYYKIQSKSSGLMLDVEARLTTDNAPIVQWTDNGHDNQQWIFTPVA